jgi:group I intron endonuclease
MAVEEQKKGFIYLLTNLVNGKKYVGQTRAKTVERRWKKHIYDCDHGSRFPLYHAMRKNVRETGELKFSAEIMWTGDASLLDAKEIYYIKKLHTLIDNPIEPGGYNLTTGGGHYKASEVSKRKLRRSLKRAHRNDPSIGPRRSIGLKKFYEDPAECKRLSRQLKADWARPGAAEKRRLTPASQKRRTAKVKAHYDEPGARERQAAIVQASYDSDPTRRARLSESLKQANAADPSIGKKRGLKLRGKKRSEAAKECNRVASKAQWADPIKRATLVAGLRAGAKRRWSRVKERRSHVEA